MAATTCSGRVMTGTWPAPRITTSWEPGIAWVAISELARGMMASSSPWMMRVGSRTPSSLSATRSGPHRAARAYPDSVGDWPARALPCAPLCRPVGPRRGSRLGGCCPRRSPLRAGIRPRVAHGGLSCTEPLIPHPRYRVSTGRNLRRPDHYSPGLTARPTDVRVPVLGVRGPGRGAARRSRQRAPFGPFPAH
jgi:hypothetical protein